MGTCEERYSIRRNVWCQWARRALGVVRFLVLLAPLPAAGCLFPSISSTPHVQNDFAEAAEKLRASVAVVVDRSFTDARFVTVEYGPAHGTRTPAFDVKVNIGVSSLKLLELTLPKLFETVIFVESKEEAGGKDFILYPRIVSFSRTGEGVAEIDYEFEFVRGSDSERVEVLREWGSGEFKPRLVGWRLILLPVWLPVCMLIGPGTCDSRDLAAGFASAQKVAFRKFVASLPQSKVAAEVNRIRGQ